MVVVSLARICESEYVSLVLPRTLAGGPAVLARRSGNARRVSNSTVVPRSASVPDDVVGEHVGIMGNTIYQRCVQKYPVTGETRLQPSKMFGSEWDP